MITLKGQGVCGGIAFGNLYILKKKQRDIKRSHISDTEAETERFENARKEALCQLEELYNKALSEVGEENAAIFEIHSMMLSDEDYLEGIRSVISEQMLDAQTAVATVSDRFASMFASMEDSYMQARAADVSDISRRLEAILCDDTTDAIASDVPVVIAADDLAPSETVQMDKEKILAFVTQGGSANSHTSILARTMNIPAIVGVEEIVDDEFGNKEVIVDGFSGTVYIEPDEKTVRKMRDRKKKTEKQKKLLDRLKGVKPVTKDGKEILLYANIGGLSDIAAVYANDAQGVGLFRSEFVYLERNTYPDEDEQFMIYKSAAEKMAFKRLIIRTLDIGADKNVEYFHMPKEENPAMGVRAIRICLSRPDVFKTQLRAIYRASAFGKISIMFPMITSVTEVIAIKKICREVCRELDHEGIGYDRDVELGIMIETPCAAIISDKLAEEVDFFSIGTNDLTQYSLALDRQNPALEPFCDTHHLAILRMIKTVVDNAHNHGIWAGICGELASDMELTELLLAIGVDELSVSPPYVLSIKEKILATDISKIRDDVLKKLE